MRTSDRVYHNKYGYGTVVMIRQNMEYDILIILDTTLHPMWVKSHELEVVKTKVLRRK